MTNSNSCDERSPVCYAFLSDITVVEVAGGLTEYAGTILAGLGADVWLVEPPDGSPTRWRQPRVDYGEHSRRSIPFIARNVGKRSVVIDMSKSYGARQLSGLLGKCDVVLMDSASTLLEYVRDCNKPVVRMTDPHGLGRSSIVSFAASGALSSSGWPHQAPCNAPSWIALDAAGTFAAIACVLAILEKDRTGQARDIEVPLTEAAIAGLTNWTRALYSYGTVSAGQGAETWRSGSGPFPIVPCANGYVRIIAATPPQWSAFVELLGRPESLLDPVWESYQFRTQNYDAIFVIAAEVLRESRMDELFHRGQALGLPITPVLDIGKVMTDEHVAFRSVLKPVEDPDHGSVLMLRPPLRTDRDGDLVRPLRLAPGLGSDQAKMPIATSRAVLRQSKESSSTSSRRGVSAPLRGLRVLSFGVGAVVPEATSVLALLGAEVIKIESRYGLDFFRRIGGEANGDVNLSPTFNQANLGVLSCAVNGNTDEGRAIMRDLARECDLLMSNMRADVMERFGMDYESVRAVNPAVVYVLAQGFGPGPYGSYVSYGPNLQSFAGLTSVWAHPDDPYPVGSTLSFPDHIAGKQALVAALAALRRKERMGEGCFLDCAQFEVCMWSIADKLLEQQIGPGPVVPRGNRSLDHVPHGCYRCAGDDEWCAISVEDDSAWEILNSLLGDSSLDQRVLKTLEGRVEHCALLDSAITRWTSTRSPLQAVEALRSVGLAASEIVDGKWQAHDRECHEAGFFRASAHPLAGVHYYAGLPIVFDGERLALRRAPIIGEHTERVLLDRLRVSGEQFSQLVRRFAVGT